MSCSETEPSNYALVVIYTLVFIKLKGDANIIKR